MLFQKKDKLSRLRSKLFTLLAPSLTPEVVRPAYLMLGFLISAMNALSREVSNHSATLFAAGLAAFVFFHPPKPFFDFAAMDYTCAGIIGTALTLVLTLSVVPAQTAADKFGTFILELYANNTATRSVYFLLAFTALSSLFLGIGYVTPYFGTTNCLILQIMLVGLSLDAIRSFYQATIALLSPKTALSLVEKQCTTYEGELQTAARTAKIFPKTSSIKHYRQAASHYRITAINKELLKRLPQLQELAHKAIARRDMHAAKETIATISRITHNYMKFRKNKMIRYIDPWQEDYFTVGDISFVLSPVNEVLYHIHVDACNNAMELVAEECLRAFINLSICATDVTEDSNSETTAPLVETIITYLAKCIAASLASNILLPVKIAMRDLTPFFWTTTNRINSMKEQQTALNMLVKTANAGYANEDQVLCFMAVGLMMKASHHDAKIKGYSNAFSTFRYVLAQLPSLINSEVTQDAKACGRKSELP